ncbi:MAG: hypothetical protein EOP11_00150 [Proteobacteria bacterium]|nr:MAG: hypothetical protein EOP11_00150 [Pseudomonadota bacterium]
MLSITYLFAFAASAFAESYQCTTEFGETVPLALAVLKSGAACEGCESAESPASRIPEKHLDKALSKRWNEEARRLTGPGQVKRRELALDNRKIYLDTRYLHRPGPDFKINVTCEKEKCDGAFEGGKDFLSFPVALVDERTKEGGEAELKFGRREHLGLIVRIKKKAVGLPAGGTIPVSASGELKIYRTDPLFIQDVGADEQLPILPGLTERIAALEIKIRCRRGG